MGYFSENVQAGGSGAADTEVGSERNPFALHNSMDAMMNDGSFDTCTAVSQGRGCPISGLPCPGECIYAEILARIPIGIIVIDALRRSVVFRNQAASALFGGHVDMAQCDSLLSLLVPEGFPGHGESEARTIKLGERIVGYTAYSMVHGYLCVLARDITERERAKEQTNLLAAVIECAPEAVVITDTAGTIEYVNPAFETSTGYSRAEAIGRNPRIVKSTAHDASFYKSMWETISSGRIWRGILTNRHKDGTLYHEEATISPVRNGDGIVKNYVAVKRDITERLRLESIAEAVNSMENIGYIFAGIRHEIGNPINTLRTTLGVLNDNVGRWPTSTVAQYVERSLGEISRIEDLLKSLKTFNMHERLEPRAVLPADFLGEFHDLSTDECKARGIELKTLVPPGLPPMFVDPRALRQVLLNIFANACEAVEGRDDAKVVISALSVGGTITLRVIDNGCGMTEQQQCKLFSPFVTSKAKGTGLGLVIVRKMLTTMHCSIDVTSSLNAGTIVDIGIPRCDSPGESDRTMDPRCNRVVPSEFRAGLS